MLTGEVPVPYRFPVDLWYRIGILPGMGPDVHGQLGGGAGRRSRIMGESAFEQVSEGLMRIGEVLDFLGVSRAFLYAEMARGALPWVKLGRSRRVPRRAVLEYAATRLGLFEDRHPR